MKLNESRKLLLSDTLVPDIFITEYLPSLSGLSVKLYVYLLLSVRTGRTVSAQDLARRMGSDEESIRTALLELASWQLIDQQQEQDAVIIQDIKSMEIERLYRPKTTNQPSEALDRQAKFSQREKLMGDINKTFFQGLMSPSWFGEIDNWFDQYRFDPEVIYALFQECGRRNKLDSKAYIARVAENWSQRGIVTYADLNRYFLEHEKVNKICQRIGQKLRRRLTAYDEEMVSRWVEKMGFDFDVIELALRKTVRLANPNLAYIDKILEDWFSHQLHTVEAIQTYEKERSSRQRGKRSGSQKTGNAGNFDQREYSDDYLQSFFEQIPLEGGEPQPPSDAVDHKGGDT
ncbi:MAG: DnaD domain protein [Clostridia bacterium]|nr:DnaD domain protein [Eubacteriales bacterium]MDD3866502.1 DnaD domain protein [Eubacteriales bacterium]MDD4460719.1 DnaD domain protein [Eubacteriales bacterium]NCC47563.1 DnaD domain protein [Clostridia bacterium]